MGGSWKVGELARAAGLTVRTLHHYDEIGLLSPSGRSLSGHRLYGEADAERLYRIIALRQHGLSLDDIATCLRDHGSVTDRLRDQLALVDQELATRQELRNRLSGLVRVVEYARKMNVDDLVGVIERTVTMNETIRGYYTDEQHAALAERQERLGEDAIRAVEEEWPELIAKVQAEMDAGTDPADPTVQALAGRWSELVEAFHGGDEAIKESARRLWEEQGDRLRATFGGPSAEVLDYIGRAGRRH